MVLIHVDRIEDIGRRRIDWVQDRTYYSGL